MKSSTLHGLVLAACVAVTAAVLVWRSPARQAFTHKPVESPLAIVPPGAALVLSVDVTRLGESAAGKALLQQSAGALGLGSDDCAAQTLSRAKSLALSVDGATDQIITPEPSELALIVSGPFNAGFVAGCAEKALRAKGGDPARSQIGSFLTVRDHKGRAGEVAVRDGGPLVISNGRYLRDILDAAEGKARAPGELEAARDALHRKLRQSFGKDAPVVATVTLPSGWLERMLDDREARLSPFSALASAALRVEPAGDGFVLEALLVHRDEQSAAQVAELFGELTPILKPWLDENASTRLIAQLTPRRSGAELRFSVHTTAEEFERLLGAAF